ncbi:Tripartite tricarboxylate transporter TctA family protein [Falsiruegeria litorea R37]|uniref:Tripartite tricarboxylate transporter TctA family protein n=1 Tax=Falsiruegeria litorea R37 TaxID=1200284 RepID=A0A1Y5RMR1_9RHOB|nr:tripartite tricarboxylate transporter permease [Falsiruegeria litorea]SLN21057.1 Tripartite tricarboxylate transporter TctA family protein [Falsiruegeria litorea R37]
MLDTLANAFALFASIDNVIVLFIGVVVGTVVGAIPGMTTPMAVALTLPFTFSMPPVTGILLLLGVYKGGIYGGSITAILINAPGTPAASCTVLDGYPLARKGQARRALDIALYASCVADFISNISLILFAGVLASFALKFQSPEVFTLVVFSLTIIAGVSGDQLLKGLGAAGLGLLLATVGLDLLYGTNRFVFGDVNLMSGLNFIPVLIGLFAVPEIINYFVKKDVELEQSKLAGIGASWTDFKSCLKSIIRGSFIGVILGAVPGIGGAPSAFLSYSEARRTSKNKANFGKGEIEGVAAAEAGNNGVAGATMIPLLALGIPGDIITAIILGAFMIHGLRPGPLMFQQNIDLIYAIFIGIMLSSFYLLIVGKASIRIISKIADIPQRVLFPIVLILCVFGAYAVNNSTYDVGVMLVMGLVGYAMLKMAIPAAPFLIAFILGPLLEDNFRQSLTISRGDYSIFFSSTICWVFWGLTALTIGLLIWQRVGGVKTEVPLS